jgi:hypothetical protein
MSYHLLKRSCCEVCGLGAFWHEGWFLVAENRWLDRVKVLQWDSQLSSRRGVMSVCCREHLKMLLENWTSIATRRLPVHNYPALPIGSDPRLVEVDLSNIEASHLIGELAIHRESGSRTWSGSPEALDYIMDAIAGSEAQRREARHQHKIRERESREATTNKDGGHSLEHPVAPPIREPLFEFSLQ